MKIVIANINKVMEVALLPFAKAMDAVYINNPEKLTVDFIKGIGPDYIFFTHWSDKVKADIFENYNCVVFHMTDLPFGRGGSPLQNLIVRGYKTTKISALKMTGELDAGDIYLKKNLSLTGTAKEIFLRAGNVILEMINEIIATNPKPIAQKGEIVIFKRRKPEEGSIAVLKELEEVYDYIRMLDSESYPNAFLETENFKIEFSSASLKKDELTAHVRIIKK